MFSGHFGAAMFFKLLTGNRYSLATLYIATVFPDLLMLPCRILGLEYSNYNPKLYGKTLPFTYSMPISHSLLGVLIGALVCPIWQVLWRGYITRASTIILGLAVLSHWLIDLVVHRGTLPILPFSKDPSNFVGFSVWNLDNEINFAIELALLIVPAFLLLLTGRIGSGNFTTILVFILLIVHIVVQCDVNFVSPYNTKPAKTEQIIPMMAGMYTVFLLVAHFADGNKVRPQEKQKVY